MSRHSDNPAGPFKKALAEATKSMAHEPDLNVTYSVDPAGVSGEYEASSSEPQDEP